MFTLKELFDDLAYSEFANLAAGNSTTGSITPVIYPRLVALTNAALLDLYTRFTFSTKEFNLHQRTDKSIYYLRSDHIGYPDGLTGDTALISGDTAIFGGDTVLLGSVDYDPEIYIDGSQERPPANDIIRIFDAYDDLGNRLHINDKRYPDDIFTLEQDIIKITPADPLKIVSILYQAAYPRIEITSDFEPSTYKLYCPNYLKNAISAFITSRFFTGKNSNSIEGQRSVSSTFWYRYESECVRIEQLSLTPEIVEEQEQFNLNGWV